MRKSQGAGQEVELKRITRRGKNRIKGETERLRSTLTEVLGDRESESGKK